MELLTILNVDRQASVYVVDGQNGISSGTQKEQRTIHAGEVCCFWE